MIGIRKCMNTFWNRCTDLPFFANHSLHVKKRLKFCFRPANASVMLGSDFKQREKTLVKSSCLHGVRWNRKTFHTVPTEHLPRHVLNIVMSLVKATRRGVDFLLDLWVSIIMSFQRSCFWPQLVSNKGWAAPCVSCCVQKPDQTAFRLTELRSNSSVSSMQCFSNFSYHAVILRKKCFLCEFLCTDTF